MSLGLDEIVGYHMKAIRLKRNLTQQVLADRANLSKQTISNIEKGQGANSKTIERLAECLDVSPLAFYTEVISDEDISLKRVSHATSTKSNSIPYLSEFQQIADRIIADTKDIIYYQQVSPVIRDMFQSNKNWILKKLNAENNRKNYFVLSMFEEHLIINIKQAIYEETSEKQEELDELIEEEEELDELIEEEMDSLIED